MSGVPIKETYNNLDIHRVLRHFPAWSQAYQLFYSNTAKLLGPFMQSISTKTNLVDQIMDGTFNKKIPFSYSRKAYNFTTSLIPQTLMTSRGLYHYVGDIGDCNPAMFAIKEVEMVEIDPIDLFTFEGKSYDTPTRLKRATRLYVAVSGASQTAVKTVSIVGATYSGEILKEQISFNQQAVCETINEYFYIFNIHQEVDCYATTALNLRSFGGYHSVKQINGFSKRICDMYGNFFDPEFYLDGKYLMIYNATQGAREDNWRMLLDLPDDENVVDFFVTTYFDILVRTDNNKIYAGKLMLDNYAESAEFESTNNNDVITLDYDTDGEISVSINLDFAKEMYNAKFARLELSYGKEYYYIAGDGTFTKDNDTWIDLSNISGKTRMFFDREDNKSYTVIVRLDSTPEAFCVKTIQNQIYMTLLSFSQANLLYSNRDLISLEDSVYKKLVPYRHVFLTTNDGLLFSENVDVIK